MNPADQIAIDNRFDEATGVDEPAHHAHSQESVSLLRGRQHLVALCHRKRHRFFDQHMKPGSKQLRADRGMEMVRESDDRKINVQGKQIPEVC